MKITQTKKHKKLFIIGIVLIILGVLISISAFTPPLNPPQCEGYQHPNKGDSCIIGANMGAGFFWILGIIFSFIGIIIALISNTIRTTIGKRKINLSSTLLTLIAIIILSFFSFSSYRIFMISNYDDTDEGSVELQIESEL